MGDKSDEEEDKESIEQVSKKRKTNEKWEGSI